MQTLLSETKQMLQLAGMPEASKALESALLQKDFRALGGIIAYCENERMLAQRKNNFATNAINGIANRILCKTKRKRILGAI